MLDVIALFDAMDGSKSEARRYRRQPEQVARDVHGIGGHADAAIAIDIQTHADRIHVGDDAAARENRWVLTIAVTEHSSGNAATPERLC